MKKTFLYVIFIPLVTLSFLFSCVDSEEDNSIEVEISALREWVRVNRPDMTEYENGLFMKIYSDNYSKTKSTELTDYDWVEVTYRGQTLDNSYYYNMYPDVSDSLGTFTYYTHYVPNRVSYYNAAVSLSSAQRYALSQMQVSDSVDIISASAYVYGGNSGGTSAPYGYQGEVSLPTGAPAYIRMKFNNLIQDIYAYERNIVREYAKNRMGKEEADSVVGISMMYKEILVENPDGDVIENDTIVDLYYTGMFVDNFVFDTNVEQTAIENNIYSPSISYEPITFNASSSGGTDGSTASGFVLGFEEAVLSMRKGEKAKFIFTSNLGYGDEGQIGSVASGSISTTIQPKDPLVFIIEVLEDDEEDE